MASLSARKQRRIRVTTGMIFGTKPPEGRSCSNPNCRAWVALYYVVFNKEGYPFCTDCAIEPDCFDHAADKIHAEMLKDRPDVLKLPFEFQPHRPQIRNPLGYGPSAQLRLSDAMTRIAVRDLNILASRFEGEKRMSERELNRLEPLPAGYKSKRKHPGYVIKKTT